MNEEYKKDVRHWQLYVLKLEQQKYYVGITTKTPEERMYEHTKGMRGAYWTKAYKPISIIQTVDLGNVSGYAAEEYENKVTRRYIKEHGLNAVRGGDLTDVDQYIVRFGRIFLKDDWKVITVVMFLVLALIYMLIDKLFL